jgi:type 1 glutamine amidotransferase/HEAT repeat protein
MRLIKFLLVLLISFFYYSTLLAAELTDQERLKIEKAIPAKATVKPKKARKLLVTNFVHIKDKPGYGHTSIPHGNLALELMGQQTGAYKMVQNNDTLLFRPENLQQFDAVCFNNTTGVLFTDPDLRKSLLDFIKNGKGFIGFHAAGATMCQYPKYDYWPEFGEMLGGFEDGGHPWASEEYMKIKLDDPDHPLNAAFGGEGFKIKDEAFQFRHGYTREKLHILLAIDATDEDFQRRRILPERMKDRDLAISWIRNYGKGRVFYCSLGHNPETFSNPTILQHFLDGIQFALGDYEVDAAPSMKPRTIENILDEMRSYEFGTSRLPLTHLSDLIRENLGVPQQLKEIERQLLTFLQSQATSAAKAHVCRELRIISSEQAVTVLETLLTNDETSGMALYALASMPGEAVDNALIEALPKTNGHTKIGIINTMGLRRCERAVSVLTRLLFNSPQEVVEASASALGKIGGMEAADALSRAKDKTTGSLRLAILDARLRCADQFLNEGKIEDAVTIYQHMYVVDKPDLIRIDAFRGLIAADKENAGARIIDVFTCSDSVILTQALTAAKVTPGEDITRALITIFPNLDAMVQVQALSVLADRNDITALPTIVSAVKHPHESVRIAALNALGKIGDASVVTLLAEAAATAKGAEKRTARENLSRLKGSGINQTIINNLDDAIPEIKVELIRCTRERGMYSANEILLQTAQDSKKEVRMESLKSLAVLSGKDELPVLISLLNKIDNESERNLAITAIAAAARRITNEKEQSDIIVKRYASANDIKVNAALLTVMGSIGNNQMLPVVIQACDHTNEEIKQSAVRALANWPRPHTDLMAKLYQIARTSSNPVYRTLAVRGYITLIGSENYFTAEEAFIYYQKAVDLVMDIPEKQLLLSGLGRMNSIDALQMAASYMDDINLQQEAVNAVIAIADRTRYRYPQETRSILEKLSDRTDNEQLRKQIERLLQ